jgi:hypothetical protein
MAERKKYTKAQKELEETIILVDYLVAHALSFEDEFNFTEQSVKRAKEWFNGRAEAD